MNRLRLKNRLAKDRLMLWGVCLLAALTAVPLLAILGEVLLKGFDQLSWSFHEATFHSGSHHPADDWRRHGSNWVEILFLH